MAIRKAVPAVIEKEVLKIKVQAAAKIEALAVTKRVRANTAHQAATSIVPPRASTKMAAAPSTAPLLSRNIKKN